MKSTIAKGVLILIGSSLFLINLFSSNKRGAVKSKLDVEDYYKEDPFFYDLSYWKKENVKDLFHLSMSIKDKDWPKPPSFGTPSTTISGEEGRRRLIDVTQRWKAEEEEMMKKFMQLRKGIVHPPHHDEEEGGTAPNKENNLNDDTNGIPNQIRSSKRERKRKRELQLPPVSKTCTNPTDPVVPCPPPNLAQQCDKYNGGDFESCFQTCKKSVCCTHDSKRRSSASCDTNVNCEHWIPCYIVWWKLSDTIGPATFLRVVQDDDFFNVDIQFIRDEYNDPQYAEFYEQWFQRFIDDDNTELDDLSFLNEDLWQELHNK